MEVYFREDWILIKKGREPFKILVESVGLASLKVSHCYIHPINPPCTLYLVPCTSYLVPCTVYLKISEDGNELSLASREEPDVPGHLAPALLLNTQGGIQFMEQSFLPPAAQYTSWCTYHHRQYYNNTPHRWSSRFPCCVCWQACFREL